LVTAQQALDDINEGYLVTLAREQDAPFSPQGW
jgi:hypothetical protein